VQPAQPPPPPANAVAPPQSITAADLPQTMIMICGTDGSGTRSAVKLLESLGVQMSVDDRGTMDIHAERGGLGGWPVIVKKILPHVKEGGGTDYHVEDLPAGVREEAIRWVTNLIDLYKPRQAYTGALRVTWGFKAPISMHLVPVISHVLASRGEGLRVLHVVRDGRDISFSGNQSPVEKLWASVHPDVPVSSIGKESAALTWWNENNLGAWRFGQRHLTHRDVINQLLGVAPAINAGRFLGKKRGTQASLGQEYFDYLMLRIEDLVFEERKPALVQRVAAFVGAETTPEKVCCTAKRQGNDMGSHSRGNRRGDVRSRYGKWRGKTQQMSAADRDKLMSTARDSQGLEAFGYEPVVESVWTGSGMYSTGTCATVSC